MASGAGVKRHIHRYHCLAGRWHCSLSDCTHFMPGNVAMNIVGKKSICWDCGKEFILDEDSLKMEKPICKSCSIDSNTIFIDEFLKSKGI